MGQMFDVRKLTESIKKKQATINRNSKKLKNAPKYIFVGWDKSSGTYPEQDKKPVWYIAKIHELGLGNQTEKRMVGNTVFLNQEKWAKQYRKLARKGSKKGKVPNYYDIAEKIGNTMRQDLKNYLYAIDLVDTSRLANSMITRYKRR